MDGGSKVEGDSIGPKFATGYRKPASLFLLLRAIAYWARRPRTDKQTQSNGARAHRAERLWYPGSRAP